MTTEEGKYKLGNKAHDTLRTSIKFINQQGETLKLLSLLKHTNKAVRVWAATFLLPICEKEAIQTLADISYEPGLIGVGAETTLKEWHKGNLRL